MLQVAAAGAALFGFSMSAMADFSGGYDPSNWSSICSPDCGIVQLGGAPTSIVLIGSDTGSGSASEFRYEIKALNGGALKFDWQYVSLDTSGDPAVDFADAYVNTTHVSLLDVFGASSQSGTFTGNVTTGDFIGFKLQTVDNLEGPGRLTISNFSVTPVPEPSTVGMMALGLLGIVGAVTARRRSHR